MWFFPVLLLLTVTPTPKASAKTLADFARFNKAVGQEITIVDLDGNVREGVLKSLSSSDLTMQFGSGERTFSRDAIASGERMRDGTVDGAIKGAIFGGVVGLMMAGYDDGSGAAIVLTSVAVYSGIGWAIDASQTHREPLYRGRLPKPALKISWRF